MNQLITQQVQVDPTTLSPTFQQRRNLGKMKRDAVDDRNKKGQAFCEAKTYEGIDQSIPQMKIYQME